MHIDNRVSSLEAARKFLSEYECVFWPRSSFAIAVLGVTPARLGKSRLTGQIVGWTNLNRLSTHMQGLDASACWTSGGNASNLFLNCAFSVLYSYDPLILFGCWAIYWDRSSVKLKFHGFDKIQIEIIALRVHHILNRGLRSEKHFQSCLNSLDVWKHTLIWLFFLFAVPLEQIKVP